MLFVVHYSDIFQFSTYRINLFTKKYIKYAILQILVYIIIRLSLYISIYHQIGRWVIQKLVSSHLSKSYRHVCLKESSSDFTTLAGTAVSDFMFTESLIQTKSSYFWRVTSLSGCEEDGGKKRFFLSCNTWQKIIQDLLCCWEINKRGILNPADWLWPRRAETGIPVTELLMGVK